MTAEKGEIVDVEPETVQPEMSLEGKVKRAFWWSLGTAFWGGVVSESIATCVMTAVCSYARPGVAAMDAGIAVFLAVFTWKAMRAVVNHPRPPSAKPDAQRVEPINFTSSPSPSRTGASGSGMRR